MDRVRSIHPHHITSHHWITSHRTAPQSSQQVKLESRSKFKQALEEEISRFRALNTGLGPGIDEGMIEEQWTDASSNELEPGISEGITKEQWIEAASNSGSGYIGP